MYFELQLMPHLSCKCYEPQSCKRYECSLGTANNATKCYWTTAGTGTRIKVRNITTGTFAVQCGQKNFFVKMVM